MPNHLVLRIQGSLPGGEVWSVTPKFEFVGDDTHATYEELLAWCTAIGAFNTGSVLPAALLGLLSTAGSITGLRAEYADTDGRLIQVAEYVLPDPHPGVGSANKTYQTCVVTSLRTGRPGRSYAGRLYWPALAATVSTTDLRLSSPTNAAVGTAVEGFLHSVQAAWPGEETIRLSVVSLTHGFVTPVTSIQVGDVLDIQRRRRDSLAESYSVVAYPA